MYTCPDNHASETPGFCSVCGLEIPVTTPAGGAPEASAAVAEAVSAAPPAAAGGGELCPDCGAPRVGDQQVFCEVCGYNFVSRVAGSGPPPPFVSVAAASGPPAESAASPAADPARGAAESPSPAFGPAPLAPAVPAANGRPATGHSSCWELVLTVDANLYGTPNADAPEGQPPRTFRLFDRETMIGRAGTEVRVQVPVHGDVGVSRRQALLLQGPDGSLTLRDLNSANGTRVDGVDVAPGVDTPLRDGAAIAIGAWTSIVVHAVGGS